MDAARFGSRFLAVAAGAAVALVATTAEATKPCGDFGECKALVEINASDGDIGFHFLADGDELVRAKMRDPDGNVIFKDTAKGRLREQTMTEMFVESAEPLCWPDPEADEDEEIVTLEEFLDRWTPGTYTFRGWGADGEQSDGETELSYELPAAPKNVAFDGTTISWEPGDDLGNCANNAELDALVADGVLPVHPESVAVALYEVVLEPDVDDGDPSDGLKYTIRVPSGINPMQVTVPAEYLASLPDDTPGKAEVGAIGFDDNATFTEIGDLCLNEDEGC